ncbi:hypothetical protein WJX74_002726 [Apatococcus lobatus]|uniref:Uncharacterized protein n=1 Tax=Apatococcus lobatus TaxID=904363 RepID=A0AAW1S6D2_9CHLO
MGPIQEASPSPQKRRRMNGLEVESLPKQDLPAENPTHRSLAKAQQGQRTTPDSILTPAQPSIPMSHKSKSLARSRKGRTKTPLHAPGDQYDAVVSNGKLASSADMAADVLNEEETGDLSGPSDNEKGSQDGLQSDGEDEADVHGDAAPDMDCFPEDVASALYGLLSAAADPLTFAAPSQDIGAASRSALEALDRFAGAGTERPQLLLEGFDAEQVWLQLDAQLKGAAQRGRRLLRKAGDVPHLLQPGMEDALQEMVEGPDESDEALRGASEEESDEEHPLDDEDLEPGMGAADVDRDADRDEAEDFDAQLRRPGKGTGRNEGLKPTEDAFMRLDDMEQFLLDAEAEAEGDGDDEEGDIQEDDEEEEVDGDAGSSDEEAQLEAMLDRAQKGKKGPRSGTDPKPGDDDDPSLMYQDFFNDRMDAEDGEEPQGDATADGALAGPDEGDALALNEPVSQDPVGMSAHERRMARMRERVTKLEASALAERDWFLRGEANAGARPLNSALEVDLDFERGIKPPPQQTEEAAASLEDLIRKRIADHRFDDPERLAVAAPEVKKTTLELDDARSKQGLGDLYAADYIQAATGVGAEDKQEPIRKEARMLLKSLFARLDALSHFHYAPKPIIEDMQVRAEVPALAMEDVAPQVVSTASMRAPEEAFLGKRSEERAEGELSREDRSRRRAAKKRRSSNRKLAEAGTAKPAGDNIVGDGAPLTRLSGRKSERAAAAAEVAAKAKGKRRPAGPASDKPPRHCKLFSLRACLWAAGEPQDCRC